MQFPARRAAALGAVLALPLSVLAVSPASAERLSGTVGADQVLLVSQRSGAASTADDGTDTTVRLEAFGGSLVSQVRFEYTQQPPSFPSELRPVTVVGTTPRNDNGAFALEWDASGLRGTAYVRVIGLDSQGRPVSTTAPREHEVKLGSSRTVNLTSGSSKGYFTQPYTGLTGGARTLVGVVGTATTNASSDRAVTVGWLHAPPSDPATPGPFDVANAQTTPAFRNGTFAVSVPIADGAGTLTDYSFTTDGPDQVAMHASLTDGDTTTDDVEAFQLYRQTITKAVATVDRSAVPAGEAARVTVTVTDQVGAPIAGAEVRDLPKSAGSTPRYTDATGKVTFLQEPGTKRYFVNVTDGDDYEAGDVITEDVVVSESSAAGPLRLAGASADGPAFDLDEVDNTQSQSTGTPPLSGTAGDGDPTDVTVQLQDASGSGATPTSAQSLGYHWTVTPFGGGAATRFPSSGTDTGTHEGGGKYSVKVPAGGNGTYELFAQLSNDPVTGVGVPVGKVLTVRAGQAEIVWNRTSPESLPAGTTSTAIGRLALPDGTTLPGRALDLAFQRDTTATANEDTTPDAGFAGPGTTVVETLGVVTDDNGRFTAPLRDPSETPQLSELGGNIDAKSAASTVGNAGASKNDHGVDFVHDPTPTGLQLTESREGATTRAGEFTLYTARVVNAQGAGVAGQPVTLTTDRGYFSKQDGTATAPTPSSTASGAEVGSYRNDGTTVTLTTGSDGTARVFLAMGRDTGFDDDGAVRTTVSGASGAFRASDAHDWTSANPLNGGAVDVAPATGEQDSAILPEAQTADRVRLDVRVTDGFGNPVAGEAVTLTDDSATGTIGETDGTPNDGRITSDLDKSGDVVLTSTSDAAQRLTASWTTETTTYGASSSTTTGSETLTDTYTVGWYAVDREESTYALVREGAATRPVGSAVTVTYRALDQKGQPVPDLFVTLTRTGPGSATGSTDGVTGQDGALAYTFAGTSEGRATVLGTARVGSATGEEVAGSTRSTSVTFGPDGPQAIDVTLSGASNGRKDDRLTVRTSPVATGAVVKLFKIGKDGRRTLVDRSTVGANGVRVFKVRDGLRTATTYVAKVVRNSAVRGATSNTRTVR